jgi:hypothetical protein
VTRNGRDCLVVISAEEYARLKRRDQHAVRAEGLTEEEVEMVARAGQEEGSRTGPAP